MTSRPALPVHVPPAVFAAALMLITAAAGVFHSFEVTGAPAAPIALAERPSRDFYLAHDRGGHVDHHVLYFGTDREALDNLRRADVLLLGNSRLMYAARPGVLDRFFQTQGLRYYVLGFGFREADLFPLAIIEKFDLRPRMVIANADGFFLHSYSEFAGVVMRDTPFGARKRRLEAEAGHEVRRVVHRIAPHWMDLFRGRPFPRSPELVIYRSRTNGTWQPSPWPAGTVEVPQRDLLEPRLAPHELPAARHFKAALDGRGSRLLLTFVPTHQPLGGSPAQIAADLGVPLIAPFPGGLRSEDRDHLDESSAVAWSEAFLRQLQRAIP